MSLSKRAMEANWAAESVEGATCGCIYDWDSKFVEYCEKHLNELEAENDWREELRQHHQEVYGE